MRRLSYFLQTLQQVASNVKGNKLRTTLTCLGMIIGIAAVIAMWTIMSIVTDQIMEQFDEYGWNYNQAYVTGNSTRTGITPEDMAYFASLSDNVSGVCGEIDLEPTTVYFEQDSKDNVNVMAFGNAFHEYSLATKVLHGRGISKLEEDNSCYVCTINSNLAGRLFQGKNPIGEEILCCGMSFKVVGVYKNKEYDKMNGKKSYCVIIPYSIASKLSGVVNSNTAHIYLKDPINGEDITDQIQSYLEERFPGEDQVYVFNPKENLTSVQQQMAAERNQRLLIVAISLLVGGIGIMNMMLVSVTERTREIGLRKAMGATPSRIQHQFLLEAVIISLMGGIVGVIVGVLISFGACVMMEHALFVDVTSIIVGLVFSTLVGIIFGWLPARAASKLNPIDALRSE